MSALAYGGPSCRMNVFAPARAARIRLYKSCSAHCFRRAGSLCGRFAFCANFVCGRLIVCFSSSAGASVDMSSAFYKRIDSNSMNARSPKASLSLLGEGRGEGLGRTELLITFLLGAWPGTKREGALLSFVRQDSHPGPLPKRGEHSKIKKPE